MLARGFRQGSVTVTFPSGSVETYGDGTGRACHIRLTDAKAVREAWMDPELKIPELYMQGRLVVEGADIYDFLVLAKKNRAKSFATLPATAISLGRIVKRLWRRHVMPEHARRNVAHHYDLDEKLFRFFLDSDLQYSCAYFETGRETLEEAQLKKKRHLAAKMRLCAGQKILDIGSGWGGMGLYLARLGDADVTGITLSEEQHRVSNARASEAGMADRVRFVLQDYRHVDDRFDRIVSIGMFEHVGQQNYGAYFRKAHALLRDDGLFVLHSIGRAKPNLLDPPFIEKYIFPNGHIPALSEVLPHIEKARFLIKDIEILTYHYADTLAEWRRRFRANREAVVALYDEAFFRMWDLYLAASEVNFRFGKLHNFQIILSKSHGDSPPSRAFIDRAEHDLAIKEKAVMPD